MGLELGKVMNAHARTDLWNRINDNMRRSAGVSGSYYGLIPAPQSQAEFKCLDMILALEGWPSNWKSRISTKVFDNATAHPVEGTDTTIFMYRGYQINVHAVHTTTKLRRAQTCLGYNGITGLMQILGESLGIQYDMNNFKLLTGIPGKETFDLPYQQYNEYRLIGVSADFVLYHVYNDSDVFKAIYTSSYFDRRVFLDLESKPDYEERVAKNPTIKAFVEFLKANKHLGGEVKFNHESFFAREAFTNSFKAFYPAVYVQYEQAARKKKLMELTEAKFSVEKMATVTGLEGEELKKLMDLFAQDCFRNEEEFNYFILTSLPETINARILALKAKQEEGTKAMELEVKLKEKKVEAKPKAARKTKAQRATEAIEPIRDRAFKNFDDAMNEARQNRGWPFPGAPIPSA
jgi:hypothetical protein